MEVECTDFKADRVIIINNNNNNNNNNNCLLTACPHGCRGSSSGTN